MIERDTLQRSSDASYNELSSGREQSSSSHWKSGVVDPTTFVLLTKDERQQSILRIATARVSFFLAAMILFTFSDAFGGIQLTMVRLNNVTAANEQTYHQLEGYLLAGICIGCLIAGCVYDHVRFALLSLAGFIFTTLSITIGVVSIFWLESSDFQWLCVTRLSSGIAIGTFYVTSALLTSNCGLHRNLQVELACTCFFYGMGACTTIVFRIITQQFICGLQAIDCSVNNLQAIWLVSILTLLIPALVLAVLVILTWKDTRRPMASVILESGSSIGQKYCTQLSSSTFRGGVSIGMTWFVVNLVFYGGSMYEIVVRSRIQLDDDNGSNTFFEDKGHSFSQFISSNLETAIMVCGPCSLVTCL